MPNKKTDNMHDHVVSLLFSLVDKDSEYKRKEPQSKTYPLHIHFKKDTKEHHPDIYAQTKSKNEFDIYEVWHTEDEREACSDILHAACIDGIRYFSIVCVDSGLPDPWKKEYAKKLVRIFSNSLRNESGKLLLPPDKVYYADIIKEDLRDGNKILQSLKKQLKF
jgi:hypothetical protein